MKRTALPLLALVLALGGLAWGLCGLDLAALGARAAAQPAGLWLAAAAAVLACHALRAARLHAEWRGRTGAAYLVCLRLSLLHNAALLLMPLRSGEAAYVWALWRRWRVRWQDALPSLLWLRLQDLVVLATLGLACLWPAAALLLLGPVLHTLWWRRRGAASAAAPMPTPTPTPTPVPVPDPSTPPGRVARLRLSLHAALRAGRGGAFGWACTVSHWLLRLSTVASLLAALLPDLPLRVAAFGAALGEGAAVLPLQAPASLGSYEAGVWAGLSAAARQAGIAAPALQPVVGAALLVHLGWLAVGLLAALPAAWIEARGARPVSPPPLPVRT